MTILVLDFGSQYTQLIARRCRELGVFCLVRSYDLTEEDMISINPVGVILSGSSHSVLDPSSPRAPAFLFSETRIVPLLGICYGQQLTAERYEGEVSSCDKREYGHMTVKLDTTSPLFEGLGEEILCWMSHGDSVSRKPVDFDTTAWSASCPIAAMEDRERRIYGVQFHPEVYETTMGARIFENFAVKICGAKKSWTPDFIIDEIVTEIRTELNTHDGDVLLALSGGVDSSVVAVLLNKAIGSRLKCLMVDTGLLRKDEAKLVEAAFQLHHPDLHFVCVDASEKFLGALEGVKDPEDKRKIIGRVFIETFDENARKFENVKYLAQGTLYSDVIESAKHGNSSLIKSHHNVGGLPEKMRLKLIEPVRHLFKDEVRKIGEALGLPHSFVWRHPFPGPGLGVRILEDITHERADKLRAADAIFMEELAKTEWYEKSAQAFAALMPCKSVAVKGDARCYSEVIALRAVHSVDFMTARCCEIPFEILKTTARRIVNEVPGVSRVVYDLTDKPPATVEWE